MDSHKDTLAVSGVDAAGRQQQAQVVPNTRQGHCRLLGWLPSRMRRIAAQRGLVLLVGMLGHPGWSWTVVADDGVPITVRPAEVHVCLATRRLSLSLAVGVRVASTWVDPPRRWREDKYTTVGTVKWFNADK